MLNCLAFSSSFNPTPEFPNRTSSFYSSFFFKQKKPNRCVFEEECLEYLRDCDNLWWPRLTTQARFLYFSLSGFLPPFILILCKTSGDLGFAGTFHLWSLKFRYFVTECPCCIFSTDISSKRTEMKFWCVTKILQGFVRQRVIEWSWETAKSCAQAIGPGHRQLLKHPLQCDKPLLLSSVEVSKAKEWDLALSTKWSRDSYS